MDGYYWSAGTDYDKHGDSIFVVLRELKDYLNQEKTLSRNVCTMIV